MRSQLTDLRRDSAVLGKSIENAAMLARLARDLPGFVRRPLAPGVAREQFLHLLETRDRRFLGTVEQTVYRHARSPYLALLRHAGCELGDLRRLVDREGVEGALRELSDRGVYVTFEELKGQREAVRGSRRFTFQERDFENPRARPHIVLHTSGSAGRPGRVGYSLRVIDEWAISMSQVFAAHGAPELRHVCWWPVPANWFLMAARLGQPAVSWWYPVHPLPLAIHVASRYLELLGRIGGYRFPRPHSLDLVEPERMLSHLRALLRDGEPLLLRTMPSAATRLAALAVSRGLDLRGVTLLSGGEPVTETRRQLIEASGMRLIVMYASVELNGLSYGCTDPGTIDDVHVMLDRYAVIQRPRAVAAGGPTVDALLVTGLNPTAGRIALNAEVGDYARLEDRDCGCLLGTLGLRTHLSGIRSFEKLTGEGVAFIRSNLELILEQRLPSRFGGTGLDYQLVEEQQPGGVTALILRISPSVGGLDERAVQAVLLEELGRGGVADQYQAAIWRRAGTVQIVREVPVATRAGKVLPLQLLQRATPLPPEP